MRGPTLIQCPWSNGLKANARGLIPENIYLVALDLTIFGIRSLNHELGVVIYKTLIIIPPLAVDIILLNG